MGKRVHGYHFRAADAAAGHDTLAWPTSAAKHCRRRRPCSNSRRAFAPGFADIHTLSICHAQALIYAAEIQASRYRPPRQGRRRRLPSPLLPTCHHDLAMARRRRLDDICLFSPPTRRRHRPRHLKGGHRFPSNIAAMPPQAPILQSHRIEPAASNCTKVPLTERPKAFTSHFTNALNTSTGRRCRRITDIIFAG